MEESRYAAIFLAVADGRISDSPTVTVQPETDERSWGVPNMMNSVFELLSFRKFFCIQDLISSIQASSFERAASLSSGSNVV